MNTHTANPASKAQFDFIKRLIAERDTTAISERIENDRAWAQAGEFSTKDASALIDLLLDQPRPTAPAPAPEAVGTNDGETASLEGMHRVDGRIYKVQRAIHGSGNLYAKELAGEGDSWTFVYAPGAIRTLSAATKMTLEEAKEFGALYGTCCVCARTLTNEASIEAGIGPVCAKKF